MSGIGTIGEVTKARSRLVPATNSQEDFLVIMTEY